jgi:Tfp pilus assembly protein PilF
LPLPLFFRARSAHNGFVREMNTRHRAYPPGPAIVAAGFAAVVMLAIAAGLGAQENLGRGRVTGNVLDENKRPLEGVRIIAQSLTALTTKLEARTDGKGGFVVGGLGTGLWRFSAVMSGCQDVFQDVDVRQLRPNPPVVLVLKPIPAAVPKDEAGKGTLDVLARGNELLAADKYPEARELLETFLSGHPEAYQIRLQIGLCWLKENEPEKAEAELKTLLDHILKVSGSFDKDAALASQTLAGLGEAAVRRNDIETGMTHFRRALDLSPASEILAYNVAESLFSNQRTDEAIPYYLMAIQIKKDWPRPYQKLGMAYLNKGDFVKALEYLRLFVAMDPASPAAAEARQTIAAIEKIKSAAGRPSA